jgi:hypothetical protein
MNRNTALGFVVAVAAASGCTDISFGEDIIEGSGPIVSEQRPVGRFTGVSNATVAEVEILQGPTEQLRVRAQESILPHLRTRVESGVLRIFTDPGTIIRPTEPVLVEIDIRTLDRILASGSGDISVRLIDARRLEIVSSGAGDVDVPSLLADSIVVQQSGAGVVFGTGTATRLRLVHSGAGRTELRELEVNQADVTMSGSGPVEVRVRDRLRVTLSGSGSLRYWGSPTVEQNVTGSGRVEKGGN